MIRHVVNPIWLVVWNMAFMTFPSIGNVIIPTDEFRGVGIPPTSNNINSKPTFWGWFTKAIKMVMTWGWFMKLGLPRQSGSFLRWKKSWCHFGLFCQGPQDLMVLPKSISAIQWVGISQLVDGKHLVITHEIYSVELCYHELPGAGFCPQYQPCSLG